MIAGRYSLEREIGRGGAGVVWLGRDEVLGRQVALKRIGLLPGDDQTDLARAEREARLSASLNHPHAVGVFDVAIEADAHWLVMEYVDGVTLAELVRQRGPLSPDETASLLHQAADALVAAHHAGIVHRDVKPSNILVDHHGHVKLTDFGIARIGNDPSLTQTGLVTGSPSYLAPEVAAGGRGGESADVWSLGATVFHLLAGRPAYPTGDNVLGTLYRIVHEEPPRLGDAGWLGELLDHTLVKDPSRRWSMAQVRDFLGRAPDAAAPAPLAGVAGRWQDEHTQQLTVPPAVVPPVPEPAGRGSRRAWWLAGGVLAVLGLVLLIALLSPGDPRTPDTDEAAQKPTAEGIEAFIRDYVDTVAEDPDEAWTMLTPKFQRESGGLARYRDFWDDATDGRVLSISANPDNLSVSYHVTFENFDNGPGPTVLDLAFEDGRYRIDGERTEGFTPVG